MSAPLIDKTDLWRWTVCGAVVLGLHLGAAAVLAARQEPVVLGEASDAIVVDLAPLANAAIDTPEDLAPGPRQQEMETPPPEPEKTEEKVEQKIDPPPPSPAPAVAALPPPEPVKPEPPKDMPAPRVAMTTAPPRQRATPQAEINSWHSKIVALIERHKSYPASAQARGEKGVAQLVFSIDRQGRVMSSQVVRSSGYAALDQETMATVRRAQPFPPPPADMPGDTFDFTVPVRFNIR